MRAEFEKSGYRLSGRPNADLKPGLIEVYPHPALLALMNAPERLEYKVAKTLTYWPEAPASMRKRKLFDVWAKSSPRLMARSLA